MQVVPAFAPQQSALVVQWSPPAEHPLLVDLHTGCPESPDASQYPPQHSVPV